MISYTDTHCHLNLNSFQNSLPDVIARARQAGLSHILVPGINLDTSMEAVRIAEIYPEVFAAIGVHPNDSETWDEETINQLENLSNHPKVVAIGEIGLDFYRNPGNQEIQTCILQQQLDLARKVKKPVILHSRHAIEQLWEIMQDWHNQLLHSGSELSQNPGVFHAFEGDAPTAQAVGKRGFFVGIGGPVTYKNPPERQKVIMEIPVEFIVSETDAPFLPPVPHRGERNEPAFIPLIVAKTAELRRMSLDFVANTLNQNAEKLLKWRTPA